MRYRCVNNLKQVGISFPLWGMDHDGKFPMEVSAANGGTLEYVGQGGVCRHFIAMSNELTAPRVLLCPADKSRKAALSFSLEMADSNSSFFVGVDAVDAKPSMYLVGDRNVTNGLPLPPNRIMDLTSNSIVGWTGELHGKQGNVCLADGSVQSWSTDQTREGLAHTGVATNRLAMP